ncbi:hypothetical protein [Protofrankia coriariae]|uniref:hypothetical protein n=1 Tax=Protofrankia coriariae TaxID=1562887 RepID=UPI003B84833F
MAVPPAASAPASATPAPTAPLVLAASHGVHATRQEQQEQQECGECQERADTCACPEQSRAWRRGVTRRWMVAGATTAGLGALAGTARLLFGTERIYDHGDTADMGALALFGAPGSFGDLDSFHDDAEGARIVTVDVPGWGFGPGQAAYMSTVTSDGTVFTATTPFSDNQAQPTGTGMEIAVFEPGPMRFTRLVVPSTTGRTHLPRADAGFRGVGGADVADVIVTGSGPDERVMFVSAVSYFGWDTAVYGELPALGQIRRPAPGQPWSYDPTRSWTTDQLAATALPGVAASAFPHEGRGEPRWSRGPAAIARLPASGHLVIAQYFGSSTLGTDQGALLVVDTAGRVRASWQYPEVQAFGVPVVVNPREVVTDPTSTAGDERFVLISDCRTADHQVVSFPIQEFSYSAGGAGQGSGTITPCSTAVRAAVDGSRMETACFDDNGTLYVARTRPDGLRAATLAVYPKIDGDRGLVTRAPATDGWPWRGWGVANPPEYFVAGTDSGGLVRSIVFDPASGAVVLAGLDGTLRAVRPSGRGRRMTFTVGQPIDIGLGRLRGPSNRYVGLRRGAVDARRRVMWLPVNQLVLDAIAWPYPPFKLDQWLMRVDLRAVLA